MELRPPPTPPPAAPRRRLAALLLLNLAAVAGVAVLVVTRTGQPAADGGAAQRTRQVAAKLKAAGALDGAAALWEAYLEGGAGGPEERARIAYSLGQTYLERGRYEPALRWFYEAELEGLPELEAELGRQIVYALERLGRTHAAEAALSSRVRLEPPAPSQGSSPSSSPAASPSGADPVVARIGARELHRSDLDRALDELPGPLAAELSSPANRRALLERVVADELLFRKAVKLGYDRDPEVLARHEGLLRQLAVARLVERELAAGIEVDEDDLRNFFAANEEHYLELAAGAGGAADEAAAVPGFDELRPLVERDYRLRKVEAAYREMVESELAAADVELFPERLEDGG